MADSSLDYRAAGVDNVTEAEALSALAIRIRQTFGFAGEPGHAGAVHLDLGYFANVVEIGGGMGIAVSTDGVGTKLLVAEMLRKYDTVGIDCIAMNVNDVLCVGARPLALLDYIAVERVEPEVLTALADGLLRGAEEARISIPGGEFAQVGEMVRGVRPGSGFDIVGTAIGILSLDRIIVGEGIADGDVVIGIPSSGIHSNGLSLARKALFEKAGYAPEQHLDELGRSVGEELLEPTRIYVRPVLAMLSAIAGVKVLAHITGNGFLNLLRVRTEVGFVLDDLPPPPPIFEVIRRAGDVSDAEMYRVFNMGVGFCAVVPEKAADRAIAVLKDGGAPGARVIGRVQADRSGQVSLPKQGLVGTEDVGFRTAGQYNQ